MLLIIIILYSCVYTSHVTLSYGKSIPSIATINEFIHCIQLLTRGCNGCMYFAMTSPQPTFMAPAGIVLLVFSNIRGTWLWGSGTIICASYAREHHYYLLFRGNTIVIYTLNAAIQWLYHCLAMNANLFIIASSSSRVTTLRRYNATTL